MLVMALAGKYTPFAAQGGVVHDPREGCSSRGSNNKIMQWLVRCGTNLANMELVRNVDRI